MKQYELYGKLVDGYWSSRARLIFTPPSMFKTVLQFKIKARF